MARRSRMRCSSGSISKSATASRSAPRAIEIRAALVAEPDRLAAGIGLGPRALISQQALAATGLVQPGSLVRWTTRVLLGAPDAPPTEAAVRAFIDAANKAFPDAGWEARDRANVSPSFSKNLDRFTEFLALIGLTSLVVGGVGVANAAQGFVERKRPTLATLKSIGATRRRGGPAGARRVHRRRADRRGPRAGAGRGAAVRGRRAVRRADSVSAGAGDFSWRTRARPGLWPAHRAGVFGRAAGAGARPAGLGSVS